MKVESIQAWVALTFLITAVPLSTVFRYYGPADEHHSTAV